MSLFLMELISYLKLKAILNIKKQILGERGGGGEEMSIFESLRVLHINIKEY